MSCLSINPRGLYPSVLYNLMMLIDCRIGIIKYPQCTNQQDNSSFILTSSKLSPPVTITQSPLLLLANCCPASKWDKSRLFQTVTQLLFKICCRQLIIDLPLNQCNLCLTQLPFKYQYCQHSRPKPKNSYKCLFTFLFSKLS